MQAGIDLKKKSPEELIAIYRENVKRGSFDIIAASTAAGELHRRGWVIDDSGDEEVFIPPKAKSKAA